MKRRNFFKSVPLLPLSALAEEKVSNEVENILEYAKLVITFPSGKSECSSSRKIVNLTMRALSRWEKDEIMIHFDKLGNSMYDIDIDDLLCSEDLQAKTYLEYPRIELFYDDVPLQLPDMSLITKMKYPQLVIANNQGKSIYTSIDYDRKFELDFETYPVESLSITVSGDLTYYDLNRIDKIFDIRKVQNPVYNT